MSTFTKEQLIARINQVTPINKYRISRYPDADGLAMDNELFAIALASLEAEAVAEVCEGFTLRYIGHGPAPKSGVHIGDRLYSAPPAPSNAEPVAWLWSHRKHPSEVTLVRPEDDERAEGAHWSGWSCQALYAAPPAPVSMKDHQIRELVNELRDIAVEYHGTQQLRERIARTIRAAMLQGADGNSPVIPDGWKLVPVEPTAEMLQSGISAHYERNQIQIHDRSAPGPMECAYVAMLAAAPQQEVK